MFLEPNNTIHLMDPVARLRVFFSCEFGMCEPKAQGDVLNELALSFEIGRDCPASARYLMEIGKCWWWSNEGCGTIRFAKKVSAEVDNNL